MATFAFKPQYTYRPTPTRPKSTATRRRPAPEQDSILDKLQHIMSSETPLSTPRPAAAPAADNGGYRPGIRGPGTVYGHSDKANDDETDDDRDLPTIEELLLTKLQAQGFTTEDRGSDKTAGVEGVASEERGSSVDLRRSAQNDNSGGSPDDPIFLLGDNDSSASAAEVDNVSLRTESIELDAGHFDSPENAVDSTAPAPLSPDVWQDIDDLPEPAPRLGLAEQGASMSDSIRPHAPPSRLSSEPVHDSIGAVDLYPSRARSEATTSAGHRSPPPHHSRASPETELSQEGHLHTGRGVADEHELVDHALDTLIDEGEREQQEVEQREDEDNKDEDQGPQQEVNAAVVMTAERVRRSLRSADRWQSLSNPDPSPELSHSELNRAEWDDDEGKKPCPTKRKRGSSSHDGPIPKKRKQQRSTRQSRPLSEPYRHYPKSHSPLDLRSRVATSSRAKGRLPSLAPSVPQSIDTTMSLDDSSLGRSSRATPPTLTEITFRPHSAHCYSFTAVVRDGCDGRGVSFGQIVGLIASIGYVGTIDDFTIKPTKQDSFLVTGFSRHTSTQLSSSGRTWSTTSEADSDHVDATRTRTQQGRAVDAGALASRSEPSSSDDDGGLSDSDPESSSDDDGFSSGSKQGRSSTSKHSRWDGIDEQRLLAYKKEDKSWEWIFKKFPGRTPAAVRTRWTMVQHRVK